MLDARQILSANQANYQTLYERKEAFLQYPADWLIRFHNMYLKSAVPGGRALDYGCGCGNNSAFLIQKGYETYGVDVAEAALPLIRANFESKHLDTDLAKRFSVIAPDSSSLPFKDGFFDFILSNQVLYYLPSAAHIKKVCKELARSLRPGGVVFFTMMGPKNYYITHHAKQIHDGGIYEIRVEQPGHRLNGVQELIYMVPDEKALCELFSDFEPISTGYFDQAMFDMTSNFHWIFAGKKRGP